MCRHNFVCVSCKLSKRSRGRTYCSSCKRPMMIVDEAPKKNSRWWRSKETLSKWYFHMRISIYVDQTYFPN